MVRNGPSWLLAKRRKKQLDLTQFWYDAWFGRKPVCRDPAVINTDSWLRTRTSSQQETGPEVAVGCGCFGAVSTLAGVIQNLIPSTRRILEARGTTGRCFDDSSGERETLLRLWSISCREGEALTTEPEPPMVPERSEEESKGSRRDKKPSHSKFRARRSKDPTTPVWLDHYREQ